MMYPRERWRGPAGLLAVWTLHPRMLNWCVRVEARLPWRLRLAKVVWRTICFGGPSNFKLVLSTASKVMSAQYLAWI